MRKILTFVIVIVLVALAIWVLGGKKKEKTVEGPLTVLLSSQNNSGQFGEATITQTAEGIKVVIETTGAPADIAQPAHIHTGSCADIGGVVYPLTFPVNGFSETTLAVSLEDLSNQLPLAINVHKSAAEPSIYVACGDLVL
jgi:hypothetical protein